MIDYTDHCALVTGAGSGIGRALAECLAERGARVICADRDAAAAEETAEALPGGAVAITCDLSEPGAGAALVERSFHVGNRLDLVCSNAGIGLSGRVVDTDMENNAEIERLFGVNFFAALKIAQAYHQLLEKHDLRGRLMVTASENSLSVPSAVNQGRMAFYGATKHALLVALEWMRIDHDGGRLSLHALLPGAVYTPLISRMLPDPSLAPPELELILPRACAERALRGLDEDLFYIPTQPHLLPDMGPRVDAVEASLRTLDLVPSGD